MKEARRRILLNGRRLGILQLLQRRLEAGAVDAEEADAAVEVEAQELRARLVQMLERPAAVKVEDLADAEEERVQRREL
jgi:hypothetical protein